jgi:hypothetical protein
MPLRFCAPRSWTSNRLPTSFRVLSAMMTLFGSAMPCKRAAITRRASVRPEPRVYSEFLKSGGAGRNPEICRLEGPVLLERARTLDHSGLRNG